MAGSLVCATLLSCADSLPPPPPPPDPYLDEPIEYDCSSCHGSEDNAAPPVSTTGSEDVADPAVGAHQSHLRDGVVRQAVACQECHILPVAPEIVECEDESPAEVDFGALASAASTAPSWNRTDVTCSDVYCHGATLLGGDVQTPVWTQVDGTQTDCGDCHGTPPPAPHVSRSDCASCHAETVIDDGVVDVAGGEHIDGNVDVAGLDCASCHGSDANDAPPVSTSGASDPAVIEVGAHQSHVTDGALRRGLACDACHTTPGDLDDPGHRDEPPAELVWGGLSLSDGASPTWDRDQITCENAYCHGATLGGGLDTSPIWTTVDGTQAQCGDCHGIAPPEPHFQGAFCYYCHPDTLDASYSLDIDQHIDGELDVREMECNGCHGSAVNDAPPISVQGASDTAEVEVGAHQSHVSDGAVARAFDCEVCHVVPSTITEPGHLDTAPAEVTFDGLALGDDAVPGWDRGDSVCSDTYCHGATLAGGSLTTPQWTAVDGSQASCGTCHGVPPSAPHPANAQCYSCHPDTIDESFVLDIDHHVNGSVELAGMACNSCHGSATNAAPPVSVAGSSDVDDVEVGAHQSHAADGTLRLALECDECHVVPSSFSDPGHADTSPAELTWGALASSEGLSPGWDRATATCQDAYCHGATLPGGTWVTPVWTTVDGSQSACGSCHGTPPPEPHLQITECNFCHSGTVDEFGDVDVAGGLHIDGTMQVDVTGSCDICHGGPPQTGAHLVHFGGAPSDASYGGTGGTGDLLPGGGGYAFDCGNCHPMDSAHHIDGAFNPGGGQAQIDLSPAGAPLGSLRSLNDASASYTPGGTVHTDGDGFSYTEGSCGGVYCHSRSTVSTPGIVPEPEVDFPFAGYPIVYPAYTVTAGREYASPAWGSTLSCDGCHRFPPRTYDDEGVQAGAGDSHSYIDSSGGESSHGWAHGGEPTPCSACHYDTVTDPGTRTRTSVPPADNWSLYDPVPIADHTQHVDGQSDVAFTPDLVRMISSDFDLSTAAYDPATSNCTDVSCHYLQTDVEWGLPFRWMNFYECNVCHQM